MATDEGRKKNLLLCIGILFFQSNAVYMSLSKCRPAWTYLHHSKKCILFNNKSLFYNQSLSECVFLDHGLARLATLHQLHTTDKALIPNIVQIANLELWTRDSSPNCTYLVVENQKLHNETFTDCGKQLPFLCETFSLKSELGLENKFIKDFQLSASSYYTSASSFGLLVHQAKFARLNAIFRKGLFYGKGWCSNSIKDEFFEIKFNGTVVLAGMRLQEGLIDACSIWISQYNIQYYRYNKWQYLVENNDKTFYFNATDANMTWLQQSVTTEKIRIIPLSSSSDCVHFPQVFCLRLELYGKYFTQYYDLPDFVEQDVEPGNIDGSISPHLLLPLLLPTFGSNCGDNAQAGYFTFRIQNLKHVNQSVGIVMQKNDVIMQNACLYYLNTTTEELPPGRYCIYGFTSCPVGFVNANLTVNESVFRWYESDEEFYSERSFTMDNVTAEGTIMFCCRNDTVSHSHSTSYEFPLMEPFYLFPSTNTCAVFANTSVELTYIEYKLSNESIPSVDGALQPYMSIIQTDALVEMKQFLCYYTPENNADQIVSSLKNSGRFSANVYIEFRVNVTNKGRIITNGLDAQNKITVSVNSGNGYSESWDLFLSNGSTLVTLLSPEGGDAVVSISMNTTKENRLLDLHITVTFVSCYHALLLSNAEVKNTTFVNASLLQNDIQLQTVYFDSVFDVVEELSGELILEESNPNRLQNIIAFEPQTSLNTILSVAKAYNIPTTIFSATASTILCAANQVKYITIPPENNFYSVLASIEPMNGVVIYRMPDVLSFFEFYSLYTTDTQLLKDIVLKNNINAKNEVEILKNFPNSTVFLFLDSLRSSEVLSAAVELGLSSQHIWYSFSPNYVISNAYMTPACQSVTPMCHEAFKNLRNVFHANTVCSFSLKVENALSQGISNLTQLITKDLMEIVKDDIVEIMLQFVSQTRKNNSDLSALKYLKYLGSLFCLPSGSGLSFHDNPIKQNNIIYEIMCQPGWNGTKCDIPVCSLASCNTTHGTCIAPEVCQCDHGWFGRSCVGDCRQSCFHGICNDGKFGDGKCKSCDWLYLGDQCNDNSIIYGFIAAGIGTSVVAVFLAAYVVRVLQTQEQSAEAEIEANESDRTMSWDDLEYVEDVDFSLKVTRNQIRKKLRYTAYKKATTFSGRDVFIKCFNRPYFQISLGLKTELNQLCSLNHNNVECLVGLIVSNPTLGIVTEMARMGSLYDVLHEKHIPVAWDVKYSMMQDICRGMSYLHDVVKMEHGRLKSTNCLIHQGWLVKITDIGLKKLRADNKDKRKVNVSDTVDPKREKPVSRRRRRKSQLDENEEDGDPSDYHSLLWTAPEHISSGAKSLDRIGRCTKKSDIYSFGIIVAEIISRRPPFSETTVMTIPHIVQAIGHLKEPIINLGQINMSTNASTAIQNLENMQNCLLRPIVEESLYPADETEKTILRTLMENCWAEEPNERPPFTYLMEILDLITPLKGSQTSKRAVLLERETESLEQYIGHDSLQILKEKEKYADLLSRVFPPIIAEQINQCGFIKAESHDNVTVMVSRVFNFDCLLAECNPAQVVAVVDYLWRAMEVIIKNRKLNIMEINIRGDVQVLASGVSVRNIDRHAYEIATLATRLIAATKSFQLPQSPSVKVLLRIGVFTGPVVSGTVFSSGAPNYMIMGDAINYANIMEKESLPNFVHASKKTAMLLSHSDFDIMGRTSFKLKVDNQYHKTYWLYEK